jgi:hypothetical protein
MPDFNWDRQAVASDVDQFPVFELVLKKRSRPAAKYKAARALFLLLLSAPYQSIRMSRADDGDVAYWHQPDPPDRSGDVRSSG